MSSRLLPLALTLCACAPKQPQELEVPDPASRLVEQQQRAAEDGVDQALEQVRLATLAMSLGEDRIADQALVSAVLRMQDFHADGQFRATIGAERRKEWKGEPYEKMMAFLYLAQLRYAAGDYGNALAMTKSGILADTGTAQEKYRADFIPAYVLQALCYDALGEDGNARRSLEQAIDALWSRALTDALTKAIEPIEVPKIDDPRGVAAAKALLLAGLPAGLAAHPRDPQGAIDGALSWATDARAAALDSAPRDWPEALGGLKKSDLKRAFDALEPVTAKWHKRFTDLDPGTAAALERDEAFLRGLLDDPGLLLWVESGWGPRKVADGRYGEVLRLVPRRRGTAPSVTLDGRALDAHYLDSVTYQAQTRGGRPVDGFLRGKAVFKDSVGLLGIALLEAGDIASYADDDTLGAILYIAGALVYVGGILVNPEADVRQWETLPDALWLVRADPTPGTHTLRVDGEQFTVEIPDFGVVSRPITQLAPGGPKTFGTACVRCDVPLAIPDGAPQGGPQ